MEHCPECQAVANDKWKTCIACGCDLERQSGKIRYTMNSKVLGTVDVVFDTHKPDSAEVDGVLYSKTELDALLSKSLDRGRLLEVHRVKKSFEGKVVTP